MTTAVHPTDITLHRASRMLEVAFDNGEHYRLPCEYLRVHSPSAEVQGHHPDQRVLVPGKRDVNIRAIEPVGNYAGCCILTMATPAGTWMKSGRRIWMP